MKKAMKVLLANPRGFCAGVHRAINIVERALELYGKPIYIRHEVVHNRFVVNNLRQRGAIFVEDLKEVPEGAIVIFSAHGVSQKVREEAQERNLRVFDATCPLVTKVHMQVSRASHKGTKVVLIGHAGHAEVEGTMGQYSNPSGGIFLVEKEDDIENLPLSIKDNLIYMTQTTLSIDDTYNIISHLKHQFPNIEEPRKSDICYATTNRQQAVKDLAEKVDFMIVVGSKNSSNSNRLKEISQRMGVNAVLIDSADDIEEKWFYKVSNIGVTAGASAPENLVQSVIKRLISFGVSEIEELSGKEENIIFELPKELRNQTTI